MFSRSVAKRHPSTASRTEHGHGRSSNHAGSAVNSFAMTGGERLPDALCSILDQQLAGWQGVGRLRLVESTSRGSVQALALRRADRSRWEEADAVGNLSPPKGGG